MVKAEVPKKNDYGWPVDKASSEKSKKDSGWSADKASTEKSKPEL